MGRQERVGRQEREEQEGRSRRGSRKSMLGLGGACVGTDAPKQGKDWQAQLKEKDSQHRAIVPPALVSTFF